MHIVIKIILAVLLFGCLFKMPYGYFQFIRIAGCAGFVYLAYVELEAKKNITGILSIAAAILFNPIFKIYFTRQLWNTIDVVIGLLLIFWSLIDVIQSK